MMVPPSTITSEVDADAVADAALLRQVRVLRPYRPLDLDRGFDRFDHAAELDNGAVALEIDEAAAVPGQERLDHLQAQPLQPAEGAGLVALHEPAVADHVRRHDGRQPALQPRLRHRRPSFG